MRDALLRSMPRRAVQAFEEMLRRTEPAIPGKVESARREIMDIVRRLADDGDIELRLVAEEALR